MIINILKSLALGILVALLLFRATGKIEKEDAPWIGVSSLIIAVIYYILIYVVIEF